MEAEPMNGAMKSGSVRISSGGIFPCRYSLALVQDRQAVETFGQTEILAGLQGVRGRLVCPQLAGASDGENPTLILENGVEFEIDVDLDSAGAGTFISASQPRKPPGA